MCPDARGPPAITWLPARNDTYSGAAHNYHNLIFKRSAGLSNLFDRIIDRSRSLGRPDLRTTFLGTKVYRSFQGKLQTKIIDRDQAHPVVKTWYKTGWIKQYEKQGRLLRTECTVKNTYDVGVQKSLRNLVALR